MRWDRIDKRLSVLEKYIPEPMYFLGSDGNWKTIEEWCSPDNHDDFADRTKGCNYADFEKYLDRMYTRAEEKMKSWENGR